MSKSRLYSRVVLVAVWQLSVSWSLRPRNCEAAATCGRHGHCELPAILWLNPKNVRLRFAFADGEAKNPAISANRMVASLLVAAVVIAILRYKLCAAKFGSDWMMGEAKGCRPNPVSHWSVEML